MGDARIRLVREVAEIIRDRHYDLDNALVQNLIGWGNDHCRLSKAGVRRAYYLATRKEETGCGKPPEPLRAPEERT